MYPPFFTADEVLDMRAEEEAGMQHTYTRTSVDDTMSVDAWYDTVRAPIAPVTGLPCTFIAHGNATSLGRTLEAAEALSGDTRTVTTILLVVPLADTLKVGDKVSDVQYVNGAVVQAIASGPYTVDNIDIIGDDMPLFRRAVLHG